MKSDADKNALTPDNKLTEAQRRKPGSELQGPDCAAEAEDRGDPTHSKAGRNRFDELLARALEVPTPERVSFIETNCDDPTLRADLMKLLAKEAEFGDFLERPARKGDTVLIIGQP